MTTKLLTPKEASELLTVDTGTLGVWRSTQRYPLPYIKIGGAVRYRLEDIQTFIQENIKGESKDEK